MNIETSINDLTTQTTDLLNVCVALKNNTTSLIVNAVATSVNAAQIPLVHMATSMINTQTLLIAFIARG